MQRASVTSKKLRLGAWGEGVAARHLEGLGYRLLARNYRCPAGEVDLVAVKDSCLVFVEVKTRRGPALGTPEESVTAAKQSHLLACAETYLQEHPGLTEQWRIDVVAVELDGAGRIRRLEVIENAVEGQGFGKT